MKQFAKPTLNLYEKPLPPNKVIDLCMNNMYTCKWITFQLAMILNLMDEAV